MAARLERLQLEHAHLVTTQRATARQLAATDARCHWLESHLLALVDVLCASGVLERDDWARAMDVRSQ